MDSPEAVFIRGANGAYSGNVPLRARRQSGFTIIELMIAVALVAIACALVIPAYAHRARATRTADAAGHLRRLFSGAATYYGFEHWGSGRGSRQLARNPFTHCSVAAATLSADRLHVVPRDRSSTASFPEAWLPTEGDELSFAALGFSVTAPTDLELAIAGSTDRCGIDPDTTIYTFEAFGDLDGDGVRSTFELAASSDEANDLYRSPGIYVVDPLE